MLTFFFFKFFCFLIIFFFFFGVYIFAIFSHCLMLHSVLSLDPHATKQNSINKKDNFFLLFVLLAEIGGSLDSNMQ